MVGLEYCKGLGTLVLYWSIRNGIKLFQMCSGCGSVGRAVPSDTRELWFESSHQQNKVYNEYLGTANC